MQPGWRLLTATAAAVNGGLQVALAGTLVEGQHHVARERDLVGAILALRLTAVVRNQTLGASQAIGDLKAATDVPLLTQAVLKLALGVGRTLIGVEALTTAAVAGEVVVALGGPSQPRVTGAEVSLTSGLADDIGTRRKLRLVLSLAGPIPVTPVKDVARILGLDFSAHVGGSIPTKTLLPVLNTLRVLLAVFACKNLAFGLERRRRLHENGFTYGGS